MNNPRCFASHMGMWLIEPRYMASALSAIRAGIRPVRAAMDDAEEDATGLFRVVDGVAEIMVDGPMMKGWSKFGGTSTVWVRQKLRESMAMEAVRGVLLRISSPGGTVAGTQALADDIWNLQKRTGKPVHAHVEDTGASAALWVARQAGRVTVENASAMVGSMGVISVLEDSSGQAEADGVKVHVIATGKFKGTGVEGAPIDEEQIAEVRAIVDGLGAQFRAALRRGGMSAAQLDVISDGRVVLGEEAVRLGMADAVEPLDAARAAMPKSPRRSRMAASLAEQRRRFGA